MNKEKSYYECKRCFIKFYQKNDMKRHLDKKHKCTRILESFKYDDKNIYNLSLERVQFDTHNEYICTVCNKKYKNYKTLLNHQKKCCTEINTEINAEINTEINKILNIEDAINLTLNSTINPKINPSNMHTLNSSNASGNVINVIDKNYVNNNITINNIINFNLAKDFKEDWDISKIDNQLKLLLLNSSYKFTKTLENILDNEVNLNVLIDNTTNSGFVFTENSLKKMDIDDILKQSMEKIYNHLVQFKNDLVNDSTTNRISLNNISLQSLEYQIKEVKDKYDDYRRIKDKTYAVNDIIKNIYNKKKEETIIELDKTIKEIEGY
jgi:hypothetical protein